MRGGEWAVADVILIVLAVAALGAAVAAITYFASFPSPW